MELHSVSQSYANWADRPLRVRKCRASRRSVPARRAATRRWTCRWASAWSQAPRSRPWVRGSGCPCRRLVYGADRELTPKRLAVLLLGFAIGDVAVLRALEPCRRTDLVGAVGVDRGAGRDHRHAAHQPAVEVAFGSDFGRVVGDRDEAAEHLVGAARAHRRAAGPEVLGLAPGRQPATERAITEGARRVAVFRFDPTALGGAFLRECIAGALGRRRAVGGDLFGEEAVADDLVGVVEQRKDLRRRGGSEATRSSSCRYRRRW